MLDWVPYVYGVAKLVGAAGSPSKLVLEARRWDEDMLCAAFGSVKVLPSVEGEGEKIGSVVDVAVGNLH